MSESKQIQWGPEEKSNARSEVIFGSVAGAAIGSLDWFLPIHSWIMENPLYFVKGVGFLAACVATIASGTSLFMALDGAISLASKGKLQLVKPKQNSAPRRSRAGGPPGRGGSL